MTSAHSVHAIGPVCHPVHPRGAGGGAHAPAAAGSGGGGGHEVYADAPVSLAACAADAGGGGVWAGALVCEVPEEGGAGGSGGGVGGAGVIVYGGVAGVRVGGGETWGESRGQSDAASELLGVGIALCG